MATKPLYSQYDFNTFSYKEGLLTALPTFINENPSNPSKIRTEEQLARFISDSKNTFNKMFETLPVGYIGTTTTIEPLDSYQVENEKKLFYTLLSGTELLFKKTLRLPDTDYTKAFTGEGIQKYLTEEDFKTIKVKATVQVVPFQAFKTALVSYIKGPASKLEERIMRLIKLWVPYRVMYYNLYDEYPTLIDNFKDAVFAFETSQMSQDYNFSRFMLALTELLQMSSTNDDTKAVVLKGLENILSEYEIKPANTPTKGGTPTEFPELNYLKLHTFVPISTATSEDAADALLNETVASSVNEAIKTIEDLLIEKRPTSSKEPPQQRGPSPQPGNQGSRGKLEDESASPASGSSAAAMAAASAAADKKLKDTLARLLQVEAATINITAGNRETLNKLASNAEAVCNYFGVGNINEITEAKLNELYNNSANINALTAASVKKDDYINIINLKNRDNLPQLNTSLDTLLRHIDITTKVRVVLSFNKNEGTDSIRYYNDKKINRITTNTFSVTDTEDINPTTDKVGPFYKYLENENSIKSFIETDVQSDIKAAIQNNKHIIYTGYGYSGSGKTFTLLESKNSILKAVFEQLKKEAPKKGKQVSLSVYELYGEDTDNDTSAICKTKAAKEEQVYNYQLSDLQTALRTNVSDYSTFYNDGEKTPLDINSIQDNDKLDIIIKNIDTIRQSNFSKNKNITEYHIRATPNNPTSSRAHIFYEFTIGDNGGKITIIDMGGTEDVDAIEKMYFENKDVPDVGNLITALQGFTDALKKINGSQIITNGILNNKEITDENGTNIIETLNESIQNIGRLEKKPVPKKTAWEPLFELLQPDQIKTVENYSNIFNLDFEQMKDYIIKKTITDNLLVNSQQNKVFATNAEIKGKTEKYYISSIFKKFYNIADTKPSNNTFTVVSTKNTIINNGNDFKELLFCYILLNNSVTNYTTLYNKISTDVEKMATIYSVLNKKSNNDSISTLTKGPLDFPKLVEDFEEIVIKYHCPLRRQGNFINRSIEDLKYFTYRLSDINKPPPLKPTQLLKLLSTADNNNTKLTVIAALRTDDAHKGDISTTLKFAHCINPFGNKNDGYYNCEETMAGGQEGGAPEPEKSKPNPEQPKSSQDQAIITPAKLNEDIDVVKGYLKKSTELKQILDDVNSVWTSYTKVTPQKTFKDLKIYTLLDSLIGELEKNVSNTEINASQSDAYNIFNVVVKKTGVDAPKYDEKKYAINGDYLYNYNIGDGTSSIKEKFIQKRKAFINQLRDLETALENNVTTFSDTNNRNTTVKRIAELLDTHFKEKPTANKIETAELPILCKYIDDNIKTIYVPDIEEIKNFLKKIKTEYNTIAGYTAEEVKGTHSYLQKSAETIKKDLVDKLTKVSTEYSKLIDELTKQGKRYADFNPSIKNKVFLQLERKDGLPSDASKIMERINILIGKIKADIDVNKSSFEKAAEGMKATDKKSGGGYLLCNPDNYSQFGGAQLDANIGSNQYRNDINTLLENDKNKDESLYKSINSFEQLAKDFINNLQKSTDPTYALTMQGNESLFNTIFNNYKEGKADTSKGEYAAALELSESLEANRLVPRKVLEITTFDKTVFIFASLFLRLIALTFVDLLIDRGRVKKLSYTFLSYIGIYIGLFYLLLIIVNLDDYKLRIIMNYINMHANAGVAIVHPLIVAVFGWIIYYVMVNINKGDGMTVSNDEDRVRLKYKIQVISLVIWMFTSLIVLLV